MDVNRAKDLYFYHLLSMVGLYHPLEDAIHERLRALHAYPFTDRLVGNDHNRVTDALSTRRTFESLERLEYIEFYPDFEVYRPSVLEVFVSLAVRVGDEIIPREQTYGLFESMFKNIFIEDAEPYSTVLLYSAGNVEPNGIGGPFPLRNPQVNQRSVEVWYQMMSYFTENYDSTGCKIQDYAD